MSDAIKNLTEPETAAIMRRCADAVKREIRAAGGRGDFVLLMFDDPGIANYIASVQRPDAIKAMRECAYRMGEPHVRN